MSTKTKQEQDTELDRASLELEHSREKIVLSMTALEREITRTLDWRAWVRRRPGMALAFAFALGIVLGRRD
jgi:hypothetical protein